jgi:hypothetical protein
MRPSRINYGWNPIESAPFDEDIALEVTDGRGLLSETKRPPLGGYCCVGRPSPFLTAATYSDNKILPSG